MESIYYNYFNKIYNKIIVLLLFLIIFISVTNLPLNAQNNMALSDEIIIQNALKPGHQEIEIPFKTLDGSVTIIGEVNDSGYFKLTDMKPRQKIKYQNGKENIVQFFVNEKENPLKFLIDKIDTNGKISIELIAQDTMSLIRKVILTDGLPIYATHNDIDPNDVLPDAELSKWTTLIIIDSIYENNDIIYDIIFHRNKEFGDTLFLPFKQVYLDFKKYPLAYYSIKFVPQQSIIYGRFRGVDNDFGLENIEIPPSLEIKCNINDTIYHDYDKLMWTIVESIDQKVFPLKLLYTLQSPINVYFEYDSIRTALSGSNKSAPINTYFKSNNANNSFIMFNNFKKNDSLQIKYNISNNEFSIRRGLYFNSGMEFITFNVVNDNNKFRIKDSTFIIYQDILNGNTKDRRVLDTTNYFKNYYGFDFFVNSPDSITIMPPKSDSLAMLYFYTTHIYPTAIPWHYIDTIPPKILSLIPNDNDTNVSVIAEIRIKFDEELLQGLINNNNVKVNYQGSLDTVSDVIGSLQYINRTIIFKPKMPLWYDTQHFVYIKNLKDLSGNKINDFDFSFTTEPDTTISVNEQISNKTTMQIIPNPGDDKINVIFNLNMTSDIKIRLYDMIGNSKELYEGKNIAIGEHKIEVDIKDLPTGFYIIKEENSGLIKKLIKK